MRVETQYVIMASDESATTLTTDAAPHDRDRGIWLVLLIGLLVLVGRSVLISHAHSEYWDDQYHIVRGERFLWHEKSGIFLIHPPLGEAIVALPVTVTRVLFGDSLSAGAAEVASNAGLRDHPLKPETLLMMIAVWNALLFLPCIALVYRWGTALYARRGGALSAAMVLVEPTFAANVPVAAVDALATTSVVVACYLTWSYTRRPTALRLIGASAAVAAGMLVKHTLVILPLVAAALVLVGLRRAAGRATDAADVMPVTLRHRLQPVAAAALLVALFVWALTLFDISEPRKFGRVFRTEYTEAYSFEGDVLNGAMMRRWPAGMYLGSLAEAVNHSEGGHRSFLLGETSQFGWWYYFPVVATYKVPIGVALVLLVALASSFWRRWRFDEWSVAIPLLAWTIFFLIFPINIGFRHFMPAYVFALIFAGRAVAERRTWPRAICALGLIATAAHGLAFHPDYLTYINVPCERAYMDISDSNVDWGQSLKQVRRWLDEHPEHKEVWIGYFGERSGEALKHYLGDRVRVLDAQDPPPTSGVLILSPVWLAGAADAGDRYAHLREREPDAIIGNSMRVYVLNESGGGGDDGGHRR